MVMSTGLPRFVPIGLLNADYKTSYETAHPHIFPVRRL